MEINLVTFVTQSTIAKNRGTTFICIHETNCKESYSDSVQRIRYGSACVYERERERESIDTEYTQANVY